jgi:hypothetical protein
LHMKAYPNPTSENSTVSVMFQQNAEFNLNLYDITGKLVSNIFNGKLSKGNNEIQFNTQLLKKGVYMLEGVTANTSDRIRLVVL